MLISRIIRSCIDLANKSRQNTIVSEKRHIRISQDENGMIITERLTTYLESHPQVIQRISTDERVTRLPPSQRKNTLEIIARRGRATPDGERSKSKKKR